jgi:hypothetical protein
VTVPRADATLAQRVKKLEEDFRRVKLVPSTTQTSVAPLAAVKGAVWIDSSAGNEPKVWDGTAWVPVRDETIAVAQGTADAAQDAVTPLVPLTDLAGVTSGTTITGGTQASSGTGPRVVINDPTYPGQIVLYTDAAGELVPARLWPIVTGGTAYLKIEGPTVNGAHPTSTFDLWHRSADGTCGFDLDADVIHFFGTDTTIDGFGSLKLGDGTDYITVAGKVVTNADLSSGTNVFPASLATLTGTQTLTNKNLTSLTNTFPTFPYWYGYLASSPAAIASGAVVDVTTWSADGSPNSSGITHSSGIFTVPTAGRYRITSQLTYPASNTTGSRVMQVFTGTSGGTNLLSAASTGNAANITSAYGSKTVRLAAGDTFRVTANQGSGLSLSLVAGANWSYVQVEWVGP